MSGQRFQPLIRQGGAWVFAARREFQASLGMPIGIPAGNAATNPLRQLEFKVGTFTGQAVGPHNGSWQQLQPFAANALKYASKAFPSTVAETASAEAGLRGVLENVSSGQSTIRRSITSLASGFATKQHLCETIVPRLAKFASPPTTSRSFSPTAERIKAVYTQISRKAASPSSSLSIRQVAQRSGTHLRSSFHSGAKTWSQEAGKAEAASAEMPKVGGYIGWYLRMLQEKPYLTKCITASFILTAADATTQILTVEGELPPLSETANVFDWSRLGRMALIGLLLWGPTLHLWYGLLARNLPGTDLVSAIKKMAIGQVSYGPAFTAMFFSVNGYAQGETPHEIWMRLKRDLIPTILKGLLFWPFCDVFNFRYVPVHLQPLGNNCAAFLWTIYITYVASKGTVD